MRGLLRGRLTYANVMSSLALFIAISGGAYAATRLPANSVGSKQLKRGAVTPTKVAHSTIALFKGQTGAPGARGPAGPPGPSTGPAGGDLAGTYPNPTVATVGGHVPVTDATSAGGALSGTFPNPSLGVSGGDNGAAACKSGEAVSGISSLAVLSCQPSVKSVAASGGLTAATASGAVSLGVDTTTLQSRVTGSCSGDQTIQSVAQTGAVTCSAPVTQVMGGSIGQVTFSSSTSQAWLAPQGLSTASTAALTDVSESTSAVASSGSNLFVHMDPAPSFGDWGFMLEVNGALTLLQCTVATNTTTCSNTSRVVSIPAGATVALLINKNGPSAARITFGWTSST